MDDRKSAEEKFCELYGKVLSAHKLRPEKTHNGLVSLIEEMLKDLIAV